MNKPQSGFTLIELMIAMVLGLIIVAAGTAVFLNAQRSMGVQIGVGEVQQNANFGLSQLTHDLRHANLNVPTEQRVNNKDTGSGIIFNLNNLPARLSGTDVNLLSKQAKDEDVTQSKSDQITIQFMPQYRVEETLDKSSDEQASQAGSIVTKSGIYNCEGNEIKFEIKRTNNEDTQSSALKPIIVQRYFLQALPQTTVEIQKNTDKRYALYCDYGYYSNDDTQIQGLGENAQVLMRDIDAFRIQLGVQAPNKSLSYMSIDQYIKLMPDSIKHSSEFYNVISIEVGLLARAHSALASPEAQLNKQVSFQLAGSEIELDLTKTSVSQLRQVISQAVGLRNTLGAIS